MYRIIVKKIIMISSENKSKNDDIQSSVVCIRAKWPIGPVLIAGFCKIKKLGVFLLPPEWDARPSQGYTQH